MTALLDTSVLTRLHVAEVAARVHELVGSGLACSALSLLELGHSAKNGREWDTIQAAVAAFRIVDVEAHHVRRAGQVQRALAAQGLRGRKVPDLVIAASAEDHGLPVVHYDRDFDHIAAITGQAVTWIVPAGSID